MATKKQIIDQLKDFLENGKDFEKYIIPNVDGIVIQRLGAFKNQKPKLCLYIDSAKGKGTRIYDAEKMEQLITAFNHPNTIKLAKYLSEVNPEYKESEKNKDLKKLDL